MYIHGGGFQFAYGTFDMAGPDYILQKDVVYVTLNYRVGAIGFLSLSDPDLDIPGNCGLKDQVFALQWVQRNIANFGGDPNDVTILGLSVCKFKYSLWGFNRLFFRLELFRFTC